MRRIIQHLANCLPNRSGSRLDRKLKSTRARHAQFASFLESSGYRTHNVDRYEQSLRRRRFAKGFFYWLSAVGASWIVIESAKAMVLF